MLVTWFFSLFVWTQGKPDNEDIILNENAGEQVFNGNCPLCRENQAENIDLEVGYRARVWGNLQYKVFFFSYTTREKELNAKVRICKECMKHYLLVSRFKLLSIFYKNPSTIVLEKKYGYLRGLKFPYEKWNITQY